MSPKIIVSRFYPRTMVYKEDEYSTLEEAAQRLKEIEVIQKLQGHTIEWGEGNELFVARDPDTRKVAVLARRKMMN